MATADDCTRPRPHGRPCRGDRVRRGVLRRSRRRGKRRSALVAGRRGAVHQHRRARPRRRQRRAGANRPARRCRPISSCRTRTARRRSIPSLTPPDRRSTRPPPSPIGRSGISASPWSSTWPSGSAMCAWTTATASLLALRLPDGAQYASRSGLRSRRIVVAISSIDLCVDDSQAMPSFFIIVSPSRTS